MNINWITHLESLVKRKRKCEKNEINFIKKKKIYEENNYQRNNYDEHNYGLHKYNINKQILENYRKENINELYKWQAECLNELKKVNWKKGENFIYVSPTSGGKTLVAEIFAFEELEKVEKIFFLFPLNSLINEKLYYFKKILEGTNIKIGSEVEENNIILCTYEKLNNYLNKNKIDSNNNFIVIIDEFHLISEKPRGIYVENIISKILYLNKKEAKIKIICMSGTLNNLHILKTWINAKIYISSYRPHEVKEHYICNYNIYKKDNEAFSYYCNIYDFSKLDNNTNDFFNQLNTKSIISSFLIIKNKFSNDSLIHSLLCFSFHSLVNNLNTLIFCSTKKNCEFYINIINEFINFSSYRTPEDIQIRRKKLNDQIFHIDKYIYNKMNKLINNGICYYYSNINNSIKKLLEISCKEKTLFLLTCTSTLSVGLNLLIDRVLISSPFIAQNFLTITQYKQMIGRAARLKKGDSIILVEKEHEKKILKIFKEDFINIKSIMHDSLGSMEKYIIEFLCFLDQELSFNNIIQLLSYSLCYNDVIYSNTYEENNIFNLNCDHNNSTYNEKELNNRNDIKKKTTNFSFISNESEDNSEQKYEELFEINIKDLTEKEGLFYDKKKEKIHKVINNLLKYKCIKIKNKKFEITNFCRSLCISNFTISFGVEILNEIKNYEKICLYNNFHLCYICSYNMNIASFNYDLPFLKNLIIMISDNYTKNIIFKILKFDSDIINMLNIKNQNINNKKKLYFNDNNLQKKYCKLYLSILLFMYLEENNFSNICETFKITEDVLQSILQHTYIHIHILIAFFDKMGKWIISSLLKKFLQYFKSCKSLSSCYYDFSLFNNLKKKRIKKKKIAT